MRAWKHVLLLVGILGTSGVFAPMLEVKQGRVAVEFSARQLSFGFEKQHSILERDLPRLAEKYLPGRLRSTRDDARLIAEASRWAALAYVPAAMLALLGLVGILRRRFGRVLGTFALLFGLGSIGAWLGLHFGIAIALQESGLQHTQISLMFGAHLLLVAGAAGAIVGLGALISPDRGPSPRRPMPPPPPGPPPPGMPPPPMPPPPMVRPDGALPA
jgi:hypothetical protein